MKRHAQWMAVLLMLVLWASGCGDSKNTKDSTEDGEVTNTDTTDVSADSDASDIADVQTDTPGDIPDAADMTAVPLISEVDEALCGTDITPTSATSAGTDLYRVTLSDHPLAICNDGTPAVMYIRAATDMANRDKWLVFLQGGSLCGSHEACRERWCGERYDASKMSTAGAAESMGGYGILSTDDSNPFASWNMVVGYYCSSDSWTGSASDQVASPDGAGTPYRLHFRGHDILNAIFTTLAAGTTSDGGDVTLEPMPSDAQVVLSGSSAGGYGVSHYTDTLGTASPNLDLAAVVDANMRSEGAYVMTAGLAAELETFMEQRYETELVPFWNAQLDSSCMAMAAEPWRCSDQAYLLLNHLTTPLFVRIDLADSLLSRPYLTYGAPAADYANAMIQTLADLTQIRTTAAESAAITRSPGIYGPHCGQHVGLSSHAWFGVAAMNNAALDDPNGTPRTLAESLWAWLQGNDVALVDDVMMTRSTCAMPEDTGD